MNALDSLIARMLPLVPKAFVWRIARRYVAGLELDDAAGVIGHLGERGLRATMDILGENITTPEETFLARDAYLRAIARIGAGGLPSGVSVKPSQMGIKIDPELAFANLEAIAAASDTAGRFIRIDMEDSSTTGATLALYRRLLQGHRRIGIVLQAYLRRTVADARDLLPLSPDVRICKGIYREPPNLAYHGYGEIQKNFLEVLGVLLKGGAKVAVATHDPFLIDRGIHLCREIDGAGSRHEFQMLYGVGEKHWDRILQLGHRLRIYVPFGRHWYAYSIRRLRENPTIAGYVLQNLIRGR